MGLFVVLWLLSSLLGHFHRANRETHYQPAPERSEPELSPFPLSPNALLPLPTQAVLPLTATLVRTRVY